MRKANKSKAVRPHMGMMEVVRVVRDAIPIQADHAGCTYGQMLDSYIAMCIGNGDELSSVTIHIAEEAWEGMAASGRCGIDAIDDDDQFVTDVPRY